MLEGLEAWRLGGWEAIKLGGREAGFWLTMPWLN